MTIPQTNGSSNVNVGGQFIDSPALGFISEYDQPIESARFYMIDDNPDDKPLSYASGDRGMIQLVLCADSDVNPGQPGEILAAGKCVPDDSVVQYHNRGSFRLWRFESDVALVKGKLYWLVFANLHWDPVNNFCSVNWMNADPPSAIDQLAPYRISIKSGNGPWVAKPLFIPTPVQINFTNGRSQCNPWYEFANNQVLTGEEYGFYPI